MVAQDSRVTTAVWFEGMAELEDAALDGDVAGLASENLFHLGQDVRPWLEEQCPAINNLLRLIADRDALAAIVRAFDDGSEVVVVKGSDSFRALAEGFWPLEEDGKAVV